ncbi:DUF4926 domain-containing protein [Tsukamurella paurometabola]|uniref:DUF4926 domain-containing protein n=1 Tax=Tsukamurella paurometabola TaxID=2061 RepID=A0A3P8JZC9_TSUPA|nr:DUF4926 domain-containing protein [Tsukamurella paurometabola]UEA81623.1 DUF4926 domain-containing protein [Tsukamurella paurometabola]VDR38629.1 Uncharacterised protein [Tsukamurella paurometabola]
MFDELEVVELTREVGGIAAGTLGAIVHVYPEGGVFEVEFMEGEATLAVLTVEAKDLRRRPPRTAAELIRALQELDPQTLVLVQGYEGGPSPIASISDAFPVQELAGRPYYYGRFEHPDEAARLAAEDPRGWISMEGGPPTLVGEPVQAVLLAREERRDD